MDILMLFIAVLWAIRITLNTLTYAEVWWVKEYRWDRMLIHLGTPQGKRFLWPERRRPPISPKSTLLVLLSLAVCGYIVWAVSIPILLRLAIADIMSFPITWIFVFLLSSPTKVYHKLQIIMAVHKLRAHKSMIVIGVTGSYGKTSTKEYLATILSSKFKVLKTEASKNSPIGIAEVILNSLKLEHEVFVVEMGAYKRGEIAFMTEMVKPQIAIVTAINPQHQDLFGSLENTMKAKYELVVGLIGQGIAIFNVDNERTRTMAQWARNDGRDVWVWSSKEVESGKWKVESGKTFGAKEITATLNGVEFVCAAGREKASVKAPVIGHHQVSNILAAIAGAVAAGMPFREAAKAAGKIEPLPKTLCLIPGINGSIYINDTFNNNPDAAKAAIDVLAWTKGKKVLVFQPMIELGAYAAESHASVGAYAARICDEIMLTNHNFYEDFVKGVRTASDTVSVSVVSADKAASLLRSKLGKDDAVLFKGKEAEHVLRAL